MINKSKIRAMITIDINLLEKAKELAKSEHRTLSKEIAYLLEREIQDKFL